MSNSSINNTSGHNAEVQPIRLGKSLVVAVDGPSGSGKSSVSKAVAERLGLAFLDTGAMYRRVTWHCLNAALNLTNAGAVEAAARTIKIEQSLDPGTDFVKVNGCQCRCHEFGRPSGVGAPTARDYRRVQAPHCG